MSLSQDNVRNPLSRISRAMRFGFRIRVASGCLAASLSCGAAHAGQIWLSADDPFMRQFKGFPPTDLMEMFTPDAPWREAASSVRVFQISNQFALRGTDAELSQVIADLNRRHIALAMAGLMLTTTPRCGTHVEGYSGPQGITKALTRLRNLGAVASYLSMDEPLLYGHQSSRANACQDTIEAVASQVALKVAQARQIFPHIQVGDIETVGSRPGTDWVEALGRWFDAYRAATGEKLAFFHADVSWVQQDWQQELQAVSPALRARGIPLGIIYNGNPDDTDDQMWSTHAEQRFRLVEGQLGIVPDQAVLQSWMRYPMHMLPESEPGTLTNLVMRYSRRR